MPAPFPRSARLKPSVLALLLVMCAAFGFAPAAAQNELAATLEVLAPGVEVQRVNTVNWIAINIEAIVGVGDTIRTGSGGRARVTYFADGVDAEIAPESEYRILGFTGTDADDYRLRTEIVIGEVTQRLNRLLDGGANYTVETPAMEMVARGTVFAVRVEASGRSSMLVREGLVEAGAQASVPDTPEAEADVPSGFGVRADQALSDVVAATTFEQLDAALDGCPAALETTGDVSLNVRLGASLDFPRVGTIDAASIDRVFGRTEDERWFRLSFRGGFAWVQSDTAAIDSACAGLRIFPNAAGPEDPTLYEMLGDPLSLDALTDALETAVPDAAATEEPGT
jgi:hypothetical protein